METQTETVLAPWDRFVRIKRDVVLPFGFPRPVNLLRAIPGEAGEEVTALVPGAHPRHGGFTTGVLGAPQLAHWRLPLAFDQIEHLEIVDLNENSEAGKATGYTHVATFRSLPAAQGAMPTATSTRTIDRVRCNVLSVNDERMELELEISSDNYDTDYRFTVLRRDSGYYSYRVYTQPPSLDPIMMLGDDHVAVLRRKDGGQAEVISLESPGLVMTVATARLTKTSASNSMNPASIVDSMAAYVGNTSAMIDRLNTSITSAHARHLADIEHIGETLIEEANRRDWCKDYDDIVDEMNRSLNTPLPTRNKDYQVTVSVTYDITVNVTARSESEAEDQVREMSHSTIQSYAYDQLSDSGDQRRKWNDYEVGGAELAD